jgi:hypothetical protein
MGADDRTADGTDPDEETAEALQAALREVASIDLEDVAVAAPRRRGGELGRPALHEVASAADHTAVMVELRHGAQRARTTRSATGEPHSVLRAVATATLAAVAELLPAGLAELHLDWVRTLDPPTPNRPTVVHCSVVLRTAAGEELLAGSAVVRGSEHESMARAVLDAVNRRFSDLASRAQAP